MNHTRGSNLICIRSRDLLNTNELGNNGLLVLQQPIIANENEKLYVCVMSATFPNSWYNLSLYLNNNTISFKETGDSSYKIITLAEGSYNINELMNEIKSKLETNSTNNLTYTFTYSEITNSVSITQSNTANITTNFDFTNIYSCRRMLGFLSGIINISNSTSTITSSRAVDITDTYNSIYIRLPNLANQKVITSREGRYSNIVAHIPVPLSRNTIFTYEPQQPFCMELNQKNINSIEVAITFQNEEQRVHFGKGDWEINLLVEYRLNLEKKQESNTIHKSLLEQMKKYENKQIEDNNKNEELKKMLKLKK